MVDQVSLDLVVAPSASLVNGSFEVPNVGAGGYKYDPASTGWAFGGYSGVQSNASAWGAAPAPDGTQTAFLQGYYGSGHLGSIGQNVSVAAGTYSLSFQGAQRQGQQQPLRFSVDGVQVGGLMAPVGNAFAPMATAPFALTAGAHVLKLEATDDSADKSTMVDQVSLIRQ